MLNNNEMINHAWNRNYEMKSYQPDRNLKILEMNSHPRWSKNSFWFQPAKQEEKFRSDVNLKISTHAYVKFDTIKRDFCFIGARELLMAEICLKIIVDNWDK